MQVNDIIQEISFLYELSLSLGQSLDSKENSRNFIKALLSRKNLEFGAIWIHNKYLPREDQNDGYSCVYAYPISRTMGVHLDDSHALGEILSIEYSYSAHCSTKLCETVGLQPTQEDDKLTLFKLDEIGFLIVVSGSLDLNELERNKLRSVIKKLAISLKGCLYHEKSVQDLITISRTQNELEQAKEKAEESEQLKTSFLANMSHEIRTPVNAIVGFSNLLTGPELSNEQKSYFTNNIYKNSKHLLQLISDIIDFSKIEAKQLTIQNETRYINPILFDLFQNYESHKKRDEIVFQFRINLPENSDEQLLTTDFERFQQIFENFLSNAFKFTENGFVEMGYFYADASKIPVFFVRDTGIGIPKDKQELVYERFRQIEQSTTRKYGGSGLGLALNKKLIELLGGKMWLESKENEGSCFYFTLANTAISYQPASTKEINEVQKKNETQSIPLYDFTNRKILIAEDVKSNYDYLTAIIEMTNAEIFWAKNGAEALALCSDPLNVIDLVLMDIRMPVLNGMEAIREIRNINKKLPIVVQSAFAMNNERNDCYKAGANEFISKPIDPENILQILKKYL